MYCLSFKFLLQCYYMELSCVQNDIVYIEKRQNLILETWTWSQSRSYRIARSILNREGLTQAEDKKEVMCVYTVHM